MTQPRPTPHRLPADQSTRAPGEPPHTLPERFADPDLVDRIFDYILDEFPQMLERSADLRQAVRAEFRGEEVYIAKQPPSERQRKVGEVLRLFNGRNATEVARRLQISRATVYRLIKQAGQPEKVSQFSET